MRPNSSTSIDATATDCTADPLFEPAEVRRALARIAEPGQVFEIRCLDALTVDDCNAGRDYRYTLFGFFDDPKQAVVALREVGSWSGCYVTLNPPNPALLSRAENRLRKEGKKGGATSDRDIDNRRFLLIDCDAQRKSGISSTAAEHKAAIKRCREIRQYLFGQGWPGPILADSGNGGHLLYRVDLPADDCGLIQRCLEALAARFNDVDVQVDTSVFNPARITKLYGTRVCKGDNTKVRPHRRARILSVPDPIHVVDRALIKSLAAEVAAEPTCEAHHATNGQSFDIEGFMERHGFEVAGPEPYQGGRRWTFRQSPMCEHHGDGPHLIQFPSGALSAGCQHNHCLWGWHELRERFEPKGPPTFGNRGFNNTVIKIIPPVLSEAAYHGLTGKFIRAVAQYTEATDAGILAHWLPAVGTLIGSDTYVYAGGKQPARVSTVLVGHTNSGRRGTAATPVNELMVRVDKRFWDQQRVSGLSSGEGLITKVADIHSKDDEGNLVIRLVEKRLFVLEPEFSRVLANVRREGNILSQVMREAYDSGNLSTLTVKPRHASGAHISIVAHITPEELAARLNHIEMANGFGNRFLWILSKSEKIITRTKPIPDSIFEKFTKCLRTLFQSGRKNKSRHVKLDEAAQQYWDEVYPQLRLDRPGLAGAMTARGSSMVLRLALIYAMLDDPNGVVRRVHLEAAMAVWHYSEESAQQLFGGQTGDTLANKLLGLLSDGPVTKNEFNKHLSATQKLSVDATLLRLEEAGQVRKAKDKRNGAGRPATKWERAT